MVKYELVRGDISEWRPFNRSHQIWHGSRAGVHNQGAFLHRAAEGWSCRAGGSLGKRPWAGQGHEGFGSPRQASGPSV